MYFLYYMHYYVHSTYITTYNTYIHVLHTSITCSTLYALYIIQNVCQNIYKIYKICILYINIGSRVSLQKWRWFQKNQKIISQISAESLKGGGAMQSGEGRVWESRNVPRNINHHWNGCIFLYRPYWNTKCSHKRIQKYYKQYRNANCEIVNIIWILTNNVW